MRNQGIILRFDIACLAAFMVMGLGTNPVNGGGSYFDKMHNQRRHAQEASATQELNIPSCGEVVATVQTDDLRAHLDELVQTNLGLSGAELLGFQAGVLAEVDYGVQVVKICAKCSDYIGLAEGLCETEDYGINVTHSGLLLLPLIRDTTELVRGTRPVTLLFHGTQPNNLKVPSNLWNVSDPDGLVLFGTLFTSMTATVSLLPDFTGYAESRKDAYRAYIVRKAYATATLPLLWQSEAYVTEVSDCATAMADEIVSVGYSEGGYAAIAVADALFRFAGKTVIQVRAGGAPLKISTVQLKFLVRQVNDGTFDERRRYYIAMLAAAFSSTTTDVRNYNNDQDLLEESQRSSILRVLLEDDNDRGEINQVIPADDPLSILDPNLIATFQRAITNDEEDPCVTSVVDGVSDLLCKALKDQDLFETVLETPYPVILCHSTEDTLVSFENMPTASEVDSNGLVDLEIVSGGHESAAVECFGSTLLYFLGNIENYKVADKHNCILPDDSNNLTSVTSSASRSLIYSLIIGSIFALPLLL